MWKVLSFSTCLVDSSDRDRDFDGRDGVSLMGMSDECAGGVNVIIASETDWSMSIAAILTVDLHY